jgi:vacuolar-type H+-ATPase subunit E/Vma4
VNTRPAVAAPDGVDSTDLDPVARQLEPVRRALLEDAATTADELVASAAREVDAMVHEFERQCDAEVAEVERRSAEAARASRDQHVTAVRRQRYEAVLAVRSEIRDRIVEAAREAARGLRSDPGYPALLDHLEAVARAQLGGAAVIRRDPEPDGGVVAELGTRRVDYSLPELADRALDALPDETRETWT